MLDRQKMAIRLTEMEFVYRTGRTAEEIATLADIWADDLGDEHMADVERAMQQHRRQCRFFPTPADIVDLLDNGYRTSRQVYDALPMTELTHTPGIGTLVMRAVRGDEDARRELAALRRQRDEVLQ